MSFDSLGLSKPVLKAVAEAGYDTPSAIQLEAIPAVLSGRDVMAAAQTGTGKTAGFTLPILERLMASANQQQSNEQSKKPHQGKKGRGNQVRCLIVTPTRELAAQVSESVVKYSKFLPLNSAVVYGGVKINPQMQRLRRGADVLVATPGRLLDLYKQNAVRFDYLEILVMDEADRMLDMGFIDDIRRLLKLMPAQRQTLMFSATFSEEIRDLAKGMVNNPVEISVTPRNATATTVSQWLHPVDKGKKSALLNHLIWEEKWEQVLIFSRTKHGANKLVSYLEGQGVKAAAFHSNKSQGARTKALKQFKNGSLRALVATDIAARGIDIDRLPNVVNFDLPNSPEDYVHRIGRTGRAGSEGQAVSLVASDESKQLRAIERLTKQSIERRTVTGFEPTQALSEGRGEQRLRRPKKSRKPHSDNANQAHQGKQMKGGKRSTDSNRAPNGHRGSQSNGGQRPSAA